MQTRVKVLRRTAPQIQPMKEDIPGIVTGALSSIAGHRKTPDGEPITLLERAKEFIARNLPSIDPTVQAQIGSVIAGLKGPAYALVGIAFLIGAGYLAYKLYKNYTRSAEEKTLQKLLADIEESAPHLVKIEGWREKIGAELLDAIRSGNPEEMTRRVAQIKAEVINKQRRLGGVGRGIVLFPKSWFAAGGGAMMPLD